MDSREILQFSTSRLLVNINVNILKLALARGFTRVAMKQGIMGQSIEIGKA